MTELNAAVFKDCKSYSEVLRKLGLHENGQNRRKIRAFVEHNSIDISHFNPYANRRVHAFINKECPVCGKTFQTDTGPKSKTVCSRSCSNTYFRSGVRHPNWKKETYRTTCFMYHKKECVVCKESNLIEVHHLDHNRENSDPSNLIPLCPTHHRYWHSAFRSLIEKDIYSYISQWSLNKPNPESESEC